MRQHHRSTSLKKQHKDSWQIQEAEARFSELKESLFAFFRRAPCQDIELEITRSKDLPREVEL